MERRGTCFPGVFFTFAVFGATGWLLTSLLRQVESASAAIGKVWSVLELGVELQLERVVAELPPLESTTEWKVEETRLREWEPQFAPLEAATVSTAEAERL